MAKVQIGRRHVYYETRGQGQPLVLLMGWQGDRSWWPNSLVERLEKNYTLILVDHRGTGLSTDTLGIYSIESLANDVIAVLDNLELQAASVLGVSMGGMVAQAVAINHPERVDRLILTSSSPKVGIIRGLNKKQRQTWLKYLRKPNKGLQDFFLDLVFSRDSSMSREGDDQGATAESIKRFKQNIKQNRASPLTIVKQFIAVQHFDARPKLPSFYKPVLVVTGDDDLIISEHHSKKLSKLLPSANLYIVKGGSHAMLDAKSEELAKVYHDFLQAKNG